MSRHISRIFLVLLAAACMFFASPIATSEAQTGGAMVQSQRYVETSDGLVWTVFTIEDDGEFYQAAIEGGVNDAGMRLEVSGWPSVTVGKRYEITTGNPLPNLNAVELIAAEERRVTGGGDVDPGYTLGSATWGTAAKNLTWKANTSSFPALGQQGVIDALSGGLTAWTSQAAPLSLSFTYGGSTNIAINEFDGVNAIYWADTTASETYLARTYLWFTNPDGDPSTPGEAVEFDIKFNTDYPWSLSPTSGKYDLPSVAIHESGHAIGLSHASSRDNVMYPSLVVGTSKRTLGAGDIAGARVLYGTQTIDPVDNPKTYKCKGKVATLVGTAANDVINGTAGKDVIVALGGDDIINGGGGRDVICGGSGNDVIDGGEGRDKIVGGRGDDRLSGGAGKDFLSGGSGADELIGGSHNDTLKGGGGADKLYGETGNDTLKSGGGADLLVGGPGDDQLFGGPGKDVLSTTTGDTSDGGGGTDKCTAAGARTSCESVL